MNEEQEKFQYLTKQEWVELIEKSLKTGHIDDFKWKPTKDLEGLAFAHREDVPETIQPLYKKNGDNDWLIGYDSGDNEMTEKLDGYQAVFFNAHKNALNALENSSSTGVIREYGTLFSSIDEIRDFLAEWSQVMENKPAFNGHLIISVKKWSYFKLENLIELRHKSGIPFEFLLVNDDCPTGTSFIDHFANIFQHLIEWISVIEDKSLRKEAFQFIRFRHPVVSGQFLFETAQIRALKMIWYNIQKALTGDISELKIEGYIALEALSEDVNHQLILGTAAGMAAVMGGVHSLFISSDSGGIDTNRLTRNMQWILKEESGMAHVADPVAGSYALEHLTVTLANATWEKLIAK